jgi:hypothetical protein
MLLARPSCPSLYAAFRVLRRTNRRDAGLLTPRRRIPVTFATEDSALAAPPAAFARSPKL